MRATACTCISTQMSKHTDSVSPIHVGLKRSSKCTLASTNPCSNCCNVIPPLVAECCIVLQSVAVCCIHEPLLSSRYNIIPPLVAVYCSVLQFVAVCYTHKPLLNAIISSSLNCYSSFFCGKESCALYISMYVCNNTSTCTHTHTYITNTNTRACTQI